MKVQCSGKQINLPTIDRAQEGSKGLIDFFPKQFSTFGIPEELASDEVDHNSNYKLLPPSFKELGSPSLFSSVAFPYSNSGFPQLLKFQI